MAISIYSMRIIKKAIRFAIMILFLVMASAGLGMAPIFGKTNERYLDTEIRTELVEKKEEDGDIEMKDVE